jgi:hypothetical protein
LPTGNTQPHSRKILLRKQAKVLAVLYISAIIFVGAFLFVAVDWLESSPRHRLQMRDPRRRRSSNGAFNSWEAYKRQSGELRFGYLPGSRFGVMTSRQATLLIRTGASALSGWVDRFRHGASTVGDQSAALGKDAARIGTTAIDRIEEES